jgi:hypothetical protein
VRRLASPGIGEKIDAVGGVRSGNPRAREPASPRARRRCEARRRALTPSRPAPRAAL